jgi:hypothetical protein
MPMFVVNWCGHGQEFVPWPERMGTGRWCRCGETRRKESAGQRFAEQRYERLPDLAAELVRLQLGREIDNPTLVILRGADIEPQRSTIQIHLTTLQRQHLTLHSPAVRIAYRQGRLKVGAQSPPNGFKLLEFKESLPRCSLLHFPNHRSAHQFACLVGETQHGSGPQARD